jgi:predicted nucleic acid-binding protein
VILVDTSVWVDHLRRGDSVLAGLLQSCQVLMHPFVIGELALGGLRPDTQVLALLQALPEASVATDSEVLLLITTHNLSGRGIGYVDAHLLAATRLTLGASLWTCDKRLQTAAVHLNVAAFPRAVRYFGS